ncbi:MAG: NAD-dependent epimerase/dehydratase family protein [Planctomycetaceae bacterium]
MKILITGVCGFVGSTLAMCLPESRAGLEIYGLDHLGRAGSEINRMPLQQRGVRFIHADIRQPSDLEQLPQVDLVVDAAANPSVLAGLGAAGSSRQLVEHNCLGTVNLLEYCRRSGAAFTMLSTSRVYSIDALSRLPVAVADHRFQLQHSEHLPQGLTRHGISEHFSTAAPISLYGATKLASETLALEYGCTFGFPVWINRCGVLAGAGQFGRADQGIFSYWIHSWCQRLPLKFLGFGGHGYQVRDCLHPRDLVPLLLAQASTANSADTPRIINVSGGLESAVSLRELSEWCRDQFGDHQVQSDGSERPFDLPWVVLDSSRAESLWSWRPQTSWQQICEEIAEHARLHPHWMQLSHGG